MKVFIVFISLLVINVSYLSYQGDMNKFIQKQAALKFLSEECAAGVAVNLNLKEYSLGRIVFDYNEGADFVNNFISYSAKKSKIQGDISWELKFEDDNLGYSEENEACKPSVTAILDLKTEDVFRLPFLEVTHIKRMARYELE